MSHSLTRTSPTGRGQEFVGTCMKCGVKNIPLNRMFEDCENSANLTDADVLDIAINPIPPKTKPEGAA